MGFHTVQIVYFSGTGCTRLVAETFRNQLLETEHRVHMVELHHDIAFEESDYDLLIICFPVYAFNAPQIVISYAKNTKSVHHIPAAIISVSGGGEIMPNLACRTSIKKILKRKGYLIQYEKMLVMPSNFVISTKPCLAALLIKILPIKISFIITELDLGVWVETNPGPIHLLLSLLGRIEIVGAKIFGKKIRISKSCNGCTVCFTHCPVANITMKNDRPVFGMKCILCLKCIYGCPTKSLSPGIATFVVLKEGFDIGTIQQTLPWNEPVDITSEAAGVLWLGVKRYLLNTDDIQTTGSPYGYELDSREKTY